jgi:hypothetical protein
VSRSSRRTTSPCRRRADVIPTRPAPRRVARFRREAGAPLAGELIAQRARSGHRSDVVRAERIEALAEARRSCRRGCRRSRQAMFVPVRRDAQSVSIERGCWSAPRPRGVTGGSTWTDVGKWASRGACASSRTRGTACGAARTWSTRRAAWVALRTATGTVVVVRLTGRARGVAPRTDVRDGARTRGGAKPLLGRVPDELRGGRGRPAGGRGGEWRAPDRGGCASGR